MDEKSAPMSIECNESRERKEEDGSKINVEKGGKKKGSTQRIRETLQHRKGKQKRPLRGILIRRRERPPVEQKRKEPVKKNGNMLAKTTWGRSVRVKEKHSGTQLAEGKLVGGYYYQKAWWQGQAEKK